MILTQRSLALFAIVWLCLSPMAQAAGPTTNATKRLQPDRWLLVFDTSSAMSRRAKAVEGVLGELLSSGMNGQMKPGAEIGIWTYNKELFAGVAPIQAWEPARSNLIASRTVNFLSKQGYRDKPKFESVLAELPHVVSDSRELTVVWFSDGSQKLTGTPFDDAVNTAFTNNRPALAKTRMPLVTVLRGHRGKFMAQSVALAPWPVLFPPFPAEPEPTNALAKTNSAPPKPVDPPKAIYISSPKKTTNAPSPVESQSASVRLRPPPDSAVAEATNAPIPAEAARPTPVVITEPTITPQPAEPAPPIPTPTKAPQIQPVSTVPIAPPVAVVTPTNIDATPQPTPALAAPKPASAPAATPAAVEPLPITAPADTVTARKWPLILGLGFMWVAVITALVLIRRSRRTSQASLITRSFDRQQK